MCNNDAISNLFTDYAVDLEIIDMQDIESVLDAIIKSNHNLEESLTSNDFEMIGKDLRIMFFMSLVPATFKADNSFAMVSSCSICELSCKILAFYTEQTIFGK